MDESFDYSTDSGGEIDSTSFDTSDTDISSDSDYSDSPVIEDFGDFDDTSDVVSDYSLDDFDGGEIDFPEDIPEDLPELSEDLEALDFGTDEFGDLPEDIPEDVPELSEDLETLDIDTDEFGDLPEDIPEDVPELSEDLETLDIDTDEFGDLPEDIPEDIPELSEDTETLDIDTDEFGDLPEDIPEDIPELSEDIETLDIDTDEFGDLPEDIPEDVPELSEDIETLDIDTDEFGDLPEDILEDVPELSEEIKTMDIDADAGDFPEAEQSPEKIDSDYHVALEQDQTDTVSVPNDETLSKIHQDKEYQEIDIEESDPVKTLKLSEFELLKIGNNSVNAQLEGLMEDYAAQGLSDAEIADKIAADRWKLQQEYLNETFPGQDISPHVFNGFYENGATDRINEIEQSTSLQDLITGSPSASSDLSENAVASGGYDELNQKIDEITDSDLSTEHKLELLNQIKSDLSSPALTQSIPEESDLNTLTENAAIVNSQDLQHPVDVEEIETWLKDINPNFDPFDIESPYCNNCGSCAFAVEQHLSGNSDIVATAENIGTVAEMNELTGMKQVPMSPGEIQQYLLNQGPGAHAIVGIDRAEGPGHWFNAICLDDHTVVALDGQSGEILDWPPDYGNVTNWDVSVKKEDLQ